MEAAVVGAGIGGLASAIALRRAGWDVTVLERWPRVVDLGTAIGLWPQAQRALDRLGLGEQIRAAGTPYRAGLLRSRRGRRLAKFPLARIERKSGVPMLMVSRTALITTLAAALPPEVIHTGTTIDAPEQLADEYSLVVGADGYRSAVRDAFFPGARTRYLGCIAIRGVVEGEFGPAGEVWGRRTLVGVTPVAPGQTNWYVALGAPEHTRPDLPALRERFKTWPDPIPEVLAAAQEESLLRHDLSDLAHPLSSYVTRNVVLVGDAAHAMAPSLGQGACQALVDADCLAEALAAAPNVTTALQSYDQQRRRPTQRLAKASRLMCQIQAL